MAGRINRFLLMLTFLVSSCGGGGGDGQGGGASVPNVKILFPFHESAAYSSAIIVKGTAENADGVSAVTVNGVNAESGDNYANWKATIQLLPGDNTLNVSITDSNDVISNNISSVDIQNYGPMLSWINDVELDESNSRLLVSGGGLFEVNINSGIRKRVSNIFPDFGDFGLLALEPETGEIFNYGYSNALTLLNLQSGEIKSISDSSQSGYYFESLDSGDYDLTTNKSYALDGRALTIVEVDMNTGIRRILSDNNLIRDAPLLSKPGSLVLDRTVNPVRLLVSDNNTVLAVDLQTGMRSVLVDTDVTYPFASPEVMIVDSGGFELFAMDKSKRQIIGISLHPDTIGHRRMIYDGSIENADGIKLSSVDDFKFDGDNTIYLLGNSEQLINNVRIFRHSIFSIDITNQSLTVVTYSGDQYGNLGFSDRLALNSSDKVAYINPWSSDFIGINLAAPSNETDPPLGSRSSKHSVPCSIWKNDNVGLYYDNASNGLFAYFDDRDDSSMVSVILAENTCKIITSKFVGGLKVDKPKDMLYDKQNGRVYLSSREGSIIAVNVTDQEVPGKRIPVAYLKEFNDKASGAGGMLMSNDHLFVADLNKAIFDLSFNNAEVFVDVFSDNNMGNNNYNRLQSLSLFGDDYMLALGDGQLSKINVSTGLSEVVFDEHVNRYDRNKIVSSYDRKTAWMKINHHTLQAINLLDGKRSLLKGQVVGNDTTDGCRRKALWLESRKSFYASNDCESDDPVQVINVEKNTAIPLTDTVNTENAINIYPYDIAVSTDESHLYVLDVDRNTIFSISVDTGERSEVLITGENTKLDYDARRLAVQNNLVYIWNDAYSDASITTVSLIDGTRHDYMLNIPNGMDLRCMDNMQVISEKIYLFGCNRTIYRTDLSGGDVEVYFEYSGGDYGLEYSEVRYDADKNRFLVASYGGWFAINLEGVPEIIPIWIPEDVNEFDEYVIGIHEFKGFYRVISSDSLMAVDPESGDMIYTLRSVR